MDRGFLRLWRRSIDSDVFACPHLWRLWSWCLMRANYKPRAISVQTGKGSTIVKLMQGEFIFGRDSAAASLKERPSTIWDRMKKLEAMGMITINSNRQYSIISICNWEVYQHDEQRSQLPSDYRPTGNQQPSDKDKKDKKDKNEKKKDSPKPSPGQDAVAVAEFIAGSILDRDPKFSRLINGKRAHTVHVWAGDIEKINRIDKREWSEIWRVTRWCREDPFWSSNILSGSKLREKFSDLILKVPAKATLPAECKSGFGGTGKRLII